MPQTANQQGHATSRVKNTSEYARSRYVDDSLATGPVQENGRSPADRRDVGEIPGAIHHELSLPSDKRPARQTKSSDHCTQWRSCFD